MSDSSDTSAPESSAGDPPRQLSRLLWWLQPKVALPLLLFGMILLAPFLYRSARIVSVPYIGDPFDVEAFGTVDIAPADNAVTQYAVATSLLYLADRFSGWVDLKNVCEHGWPQTSEFLQKWLADNQPALAEWRKGTKYAQAVWMQPKDFRANTSCEVMEDLFFFSLLARLQAERCAYDGDLEGAWKWLLAAVRASRHVQQHGNFKMRSRGIDDFDIAVGGIQRWATNPGVTTDQLRKALVEFREADRLTPADSVTLKIEYLALRNTWSDSVALPEVFTEVGFDSWEFRSPSLFVRGEPELSLRVLQHVFGNLLCEIDKPKCDRAPITGGKLSLYDLPPASTSGLSAHELKELESSTVLANLFLPSYELADAMMQDEAARRATVPLMLACQLHHRMYGEWPTKLEDLVPDILTEIPSDPLGKRHEKLRLKRDGDELLIYSVGTNGIDDGGDVWVEWTPKFNHSASLDQGYRLRRPTPHETSANQETKPNEKP